MTKRNLEKMKPERNCSFKLVVPYHSPFWKKGQTETKRRNLEVETDRAIQGVGHTEGRIRAFLKR